VPKGVSPDQLAVLVDMLSYLLSKEAQATTYDTGYFYPGPAIKDVPVGLAPADSQKVIAEFGRPDYDSIIASSPNELPLLPDKLVYAFGRWDQEIGAKKTK
jgi:putative spermidine/putrescine transport system substrate-binding protein